MVLTTSCQLGDSLHLAPLQMHRYTLLGLSHEVDLRPLNFVEPLPEHGMCEVCGLLSKWSVILPCRHVVCKTCYGQCLVNEVCECPLDRVQFHEGDAEWIEFPVENLLKRKVKCWNEENGCGAITNVSDMLKHFSEDCVHHSLLCPNCSALVLRKNVCAHRRSKCNAHALPTQQAQQPKPSQDSIQEAIFNDLKTRLEKYVAEMRYDLDQVVREYHTHCDRLNEVSHIVNALRETAVETSEKKMRAANDAGIASGKVKEDVAAQGDGLHDVAQRIGTFGEDVKVVITDATRQCLENLDQSYSDLWRRIAEDENRLKKVSETMSAFESNLEKALERSTKVMFQKFKTYVDFSAAAKSKEAENHPETSDEKETQLLAQKTLGITRYRFCVKRIKALKEEAILTGWAKSFCEPIYLCGYRVSPGLYLKKDESCVSVHARMQLYKGVIDEFLHWPFCYNLKLTFIHPSSEKHRQFLHINPLDLEYCSRPTESSNKGFYWYASSTLEDLEREGYIESDQLYVRYELRPPKV